MENLQSAVEEVKTEQGQLMSIPVRSAQRDSSRSRVSCRQRALSLSPVVIVVVIVVVVVVVVVAVMVAVRYFLLKIWEEAALDRRGLIKHEVISVKQGQRRPRY